MDYTVLGETGLEVSVLGLGGGGHSRLGLARGRDERNARRIVRCALDRGVNLFDTAEAYGTEGVLGDVLGDLPREGVVISTKYSLRRDGELRDPAELEGSVDASLRRLCTDHIDIYHLHGVSPDEYGYASEMLVPELERVKRKGKIRCLGITEAFGSDPGHRMLERALEDDCWEVVMVGYNLLNQSAERRVFPRTRRKGVGVLCMFAVRRALSDRGLLGEVVRDLLGRGLLGGEHLEGGADPAEILDFLARGRGSGGLIDAAYRFCRHEGGIDSVLSGTSRLDHLGANIESALRGPLPEGDVRRVKGIFRRVDCVSGN